VTRCARILLALGDGASSASAGGALEAAHHTVRVCPAADLVAHEVEMFRPDLVILHVPVSDPSLVATVVRRTHASYPPLLLCALGDGAAQRVPALEAGADACIDEPFTSEEIELHVRALLRRAPWLAHPVHQVGALVIDEAAHLAAFADEPLTLCAKEFALLTMLAQHAGAVLSKRSLLEALWGFDAFDENLVEVHISALRRNLPPGARDLIHTVRGVGYVLRERIPQGQLA
jgi:two-component system OmpR family response regulator